MRTLIINSMFANALYRRAADELGLVPGVDLSMLTVDAWRMNGRPMPFEPARAGAPYSTIVGKAGWRGFENRGFYRSGLVSAIRKGKPEVIFLMEEPFSVFTAEVLAARSLFAPKTPVVFFTWNNLSLEKYDYRPSFFYKRVAKQALPRMQYALTANTEGERVLRDAGFEAPIKTIGYGVDAEVYSAPRINRVQEIKQKLEIPSEAKVIGYVGRMLHMKGVDLLIRAFADLSSSPSSNLKLLLVGSGEEETRLLRMVHDLGIAEHVRHIPSLLHAEVPDYMHALDILVLPSRRVGMWAEQFGRVLVEAMAAGKIVIGSSSGAIPEVIGDGGLVFEENHTSDLRSKIRSALALSASEKAALQARALERVQHFSWKRFAADAAGAIEYCHRIAMGHT